MTDPAAPAAPPHLERARALLDLIDDQYEGNTGRVNHDAIIRYAATAQAHATLALEAQTARLADEARTANLIALYELGGETSVFVGLNYSALFDQILTRLDLTTAVSE